MLEPLTAEPVALAATLPVRVARVERAARAPAPARFAHFHRAAEIIIFDEVKGALFTDVARFDLAPGSATWTPAMSAHDFALAGGSSRWTLIQFYQNFAQVEPPAAATCVTFADKERERVRSLCDWLADAINAAAVAEAQRLLDLLLLTIARARPGDGASLTPSHALTRFRPLLERLRSDPSAKLSLTEAASICRLSPAYFSRLFRDVFGRGFADYLIQSRLESAAIALNSTRDPVSAIGYRAGFSSHAYFTAQFRERFGCTPTEFRARSLERASAINGSSDVQHG